MAGMYAPGTPVVVVPGETVPPTYRLRIRNLRGLERWVKVDPDTLAEHLPGTMYSPYSPR